MGEVTTPSSVTRPGSSTVETPGATNGPLSQTEKNSVMDYLTTHMGLSETQARGLLANMTPSQARTFLNLSSGKDTITRDEAIKLWGLTEKEADILFPKGNQIGVFCNPFANAFLNYLILSYSLGLDIRRMMADMLNTEVKLGIEKAEEIFKGAIVQFACAMTSAIVTGGMGIIGFYKIKNGQKDTKGMTEEQQEAARRQAALDNQWWSPFGASLVTQPINAGGEFGKQWYEREGAYDDVYLTEAKQLYDQLVTFYQSTIDTGHTVAGAL